MAICGSCGTGEHEVEADKDGMCGKCHSDDWIEWGDFTYDRSYLREIVRDKFNKTLGEFIHRLWKSEKRIDEYTAIKDIFKK